MNREPILREQRDGYTQEWYCDPPPLGVRYRVHDGKDEWATEGDMPVRRIYEIEYVEKGSP